MSDWTAEPVFDSPTLIGLVAVALAVSALAVRPVSTSMTPVRTKILTGLRLAASVILFLSLLRPTHVFTDHQPAPATLAILLDGSRSMTLPSGGEGSRWDVQRLVWQAIEPILAIEDPSLKIAIYRYGETLEKMTPEEAIEFLNADPQADKTDLTKALRDTVQLAEGSPLAGIILIGDGTHTEINQTEGPQAIAATLASLEVPLWTVATGPRRDRSSARDVVVEGLQDEFQVFAKNLFQLKATLSSQGMQGQPVQLRLNLTDAGGTTSEIAQREIIAGSDNDSVPINIEIPAPEPGNYRLELVADAQVGEIITENNQQTAFLDVLDGGGRILYLEGQPRQEQLFLRRSIQASNDFELSFQWLERTGNGKNWPVDLGSVFMPNRFDIFLIGDLDAGALGDEQLAELKKRVEQGAGLLTTGGFHSYGSGGYAAGPLNDVLPVKMQNARQPFEGKPLAGAHIMGQLPVRISKPHPISQIFLSGDQQQGWDTLKPLLGANRMGSAKPIPGVQVILQTPANDPLLVVGEYGQGRVAAFAGDTTWQWWRQGKSGREAHRRFWRQLLLWLMHRDNSRPNEIFLEMQRRRFSGEDEVSFKAILRSASEESIDINMIVELVDENDQSTNIPVAQSSDAEDNAQVWVGKLAGLADGLYRIRARDSAATTQIESAELAFQVQSVDRELSRPIADTMQMEQLAKVTEEVGGQAIEPDKADKIAKLISENRQQTVVPIVSKWRWSDQPTSGWLILGLFVGLLSVDWGLRKRWGMV